LTWTTRADTIHPSIGLPLNLPLQASRQFSNFDRHTGNGTQRQLNVVIPPWGVTF
jgi:hypothetical protein